MNVKCPQCKKTVPWTPESLYRPFCSERCRIIDLGAWADGSYAIPSNDVPDPDDFGDYSEENNQENGNENDQENVDDNIDDKS